MFLNPTDRPITKQSSTYWLPSESAVLGLLQLFGFRIIGVRLVERSKRLAVLAQSVSTSEIVDSSPEQVRRVWEVGFEDPLAAGTAWNPEPGGEANVQGPDELDPFRDVIDMDTYEVKFPPHPEAMINVVGKMK